MVFRMRITSHSFLLLHAIPGKVQPTGLIFAFCALLGSLGLALLGQYVGMFVFASSLQGGSDHDVGLLCLLLAAVAALLFWFVDRRSLPRIRSQHAAQVRSAYEALHCRDQQVVETTDSGLVMSCGCGQVIRPWEYLISFREHPKFLFLQTKNEPLLISKSAFQNEAELTEFRADILGHLNSGRP